MLGFLWVFCAQFGHRIGRRRQIRAALDGNITMFIWLGKQYLGQREQALIETINVGKLSHEELEGIARG